jgi:hypothetical protein
MKTAAEGLPGEHVRLPPAGIGQAGRDVDRDGAQQTVCGGFLDESLDLRCEVRRHPAA